MTEPSSTRLCSNQEVSDLLERMTSDEKTGLEKLNRLLVSYPDDARLHFLQGSFTAGNKDFAAAAVAMRRAVALAPDFLLARFQLGFLLLTSGEGHAAQEAWGPLNGLEKQHYLRMFVQGLTHLIHDRFDDAVAMLRQGIASNVENTPLDADMEMIIAEIKAGRTADSRAASSSAHLLLQQAALKSTRH